jgi:hypothetical protein
MNFGGVGSFFLAMVLQANSDRARTNVALTYTGSQCIREAGPEISKIWFRVVLAFEVPSARLKRQVCQIKKFRPPGSEFPSARLKSSFRHVKKFRLPD